MNAVVVTVAAGFQGVGMNTTESYVQMVTTFLTVPDNDTGMPVEAKPMLQFVGGLQPALVSDTGGLATIKID